MLVTEDDIYYTSHILDFLSENGEALSFRKHTIKKGDPIFQQGQEINDIIFITGELFRCLAVHVTVVDIR